MSKAANTAQSNRDVRATGNPGRENARATRATSAASSGRVVSIDALRGFDMFWIIGGATVIQSLAAAWNLPALNWLSAQMEHVEWEGFHFIDLIFPLFLFLIGAAVPFSLEKRIARGDSLRQIYCHIVLRVVILVVLGMMVNGSLLSYHLAEFELTYSVLQMLALGYLVAAILYLHFGLAWQIVATLAMLIGYWALLAFVPGPGHQVGVVCVWLQRGRLGHQLDCGRVAWLSGWLDRGRAGARVHRDARCLDRSLAQVRHDGEAEGCVDGCVGAGFTRHRTVLERVGGLAVARCDFVWHSLDRMAGVVPDHQEPLDQFVCALRGRLEPAAPGGLLPGD